MHPYTYTSKTHAHMRACTQARTHTCTHFSGVNESWQSRSNREKTREKKHWHFPVLPQSHLQEAAKKCFTVAALPKGSWGLKSLSVRFVKFQYQQQVGDKGLMERELLYSKCLRSSSRAGHCSQWILCKNTIKKNGIISLGNGKKSFIKQTALNT